MEFFPARATPKIYAYRDKHYPGLLKIGYTNRSVQARLNDGVKQPEQTLTVVFDESAVRADNSFFTDHDIHHQLQKMGVTRKQGEWFECDEKTLQAAYLAVLKGEDVEKNRYLDFKMRPEQQQAVERTAAYFRSCRRENLKREPHFLWNAKMRFGKTFAAYQLAKEMGWKRILVLTFKPAVMSAWQEDLESHLDFKDWQFYSNQNGKLDLQKIEKNQPLVCFGSFQDFLGKDKNGGIKPKNEWVHTLNWDCVIFDEYHFGAWRDKSKDLFKELWEGETDKKESKAQDGGLSDFDEELLPITTDHYLYLSGTPFRALANGEFIEEQIYNWTYSDEQRAKLNWQGENNPYVSLPRMVMMTYQMPENIRGVAREGEFNEFDLNKFFSTEGEGEKAKFKYENEVQNWLNLLRGQYAIREDLKMGAKRPPMPFSDVRLLNALQHTFWFLPDVASCYAMKNLLAQRANSFFHDYQVIVAAGSQAGIGIAALEKVQKVITKQPLATKTITLSCGKLTTGVSVPAWTGIFILRNLKSPETYFQAAFRVQTPWTLKNRDGFSPNKEEILKQECYVFDFAPNRALSQIAEYSTQLSVGENNPERRVQEFIQFLPVLAYDGSTMKEIDAAGVLDIAMSGTSATLLAKRWQSALLVNVDDHTLENVLNNQQAQQALENIEGFRQLTLDLETIINTSQEVKEAKKASAKDELSDTEKETLSEKEKEIKSLRKQLQEKLIKLATRIPIFMYLTDFREESLQDVIRLYEPALFKRVTGLEIADFDMLVKLNIFNSSVMNAAIFNFRRYEDASLEYTGVNTHNEDQQVGGFDITLSRREFENLDLS